VGVVGGRHRLADHGRDRLRPLRPDLVLDRLRAGEVLGFAAQPEPTAVP